MLLVMRLVQQFTAKARSPAGFADLDEEDAILDMRRLFAKRGVDLVEGEAALKSMIDLSRNFFFRAAVVVADEAELKPREAGVICDAPDDSDDAAEFSYIVALTDRSRKSTLHRRDGCWRARRFAFGSFELLPGLPEPGHYTARCRDCWRAASGSAASSTSFSGKALAPSALTSETGPVRTRATSSSSAGGSSSSTSSSSTERGGVPPSRGS